MNLIEKLKLTKILVQTRAEINSLAGGGPLVAVKRIKLARVITTTRIQLGALDDPAPTPGGDHIATLREITAGKFDGDSLSAMYGRIATAVHALNDAGLLTGDAEDVANAAITHWAEVEERTDV
ncbi:hypothetical protein [Uliginosibacterium sediminicola]|uniref:Uncharacterized protein n=1 Tax=Uliginosibacterium sediminicola TaxID=2024550 RepID=A0ABU9YVX3_9RHOO